MAIQPSERGCIQSEKHKFSVWRGRQKGEVPQHLITMSRTARFRLGEPTINETQYRKVAQNVFTLPEAPKIKAKGLFNHWC